MTSYVVIEDSVIDQVLTLGGPDLRPPRIKTLIFLLRKSTSGLIYQYVELWKHLSCFRLILVYLNNEKIEVFILGGPPIGSTQSEHLVNYGILNYHMRCHGDVA